MVTVRPNQNLVRCRSIGFSAKNDFPGEESAGSNEAASLARNGGDGEAASGELALQLLRQGHHPFARGRFAGASRKRQHESQLDPQRWTVNVEVASLGYQIARLVRPRNWAWARPC